MIYPLDIEDEEKFNEIIKEKNLVSGKFKNIFNDFIDYEIKKECLILIILIENFSENSSVNSLNYYFYRFKEKNNNINNVNNLIEIQDNNLNLINKDIKLEVTYPINTNFIQKNGEKITKTLEDIKNIFGDISLINPNDAFFKDICIKYESNINADMTLNERYNKFFNDIQFCESNCNIKNISVIEEKTLSICDCKLKYKFSLDNQQKQKENTNKKSNSNFKVITCINELFKEYSIKSNINFWICLILFILQIYAILNFFCKGKKQILKILKSNNNENTNNEQLNIINNPPKKTLKSVLKRGNFHYNSNEKEEENNDNNNNKESNINYDRSNMKNNFDVNNVIKNEFSEHKKSIISVSENSNRVKIDDNNNNKSSSRNFLRNDYNKDSLISQSKDELHLSQNISKIINNQNHRLDIDFESNFFSARKRNNNLNNTNDSNVINNNLINNISNKNIENVVDENSKNNNSINNNNSNIRNQTKKINILNENINDNDSLKDNSTNHINNSIKIINNALKIQNLKANNNEIQLKHNNQSKCSSSSKTNQNKEVIIPPLKLNINQNNPLNQPYNLNQINNENSKDESKTKELSSEKTEEEKEIEEINEIESIKVDIIEEKLNKIKQEDEFQIIENRPLNIENNFFSCLCQYFKNREIFCITYFNEQNTTPKFIRRSSLFFCLTFIFTINCIFYDESLVDKRYQNILKDESNNNGISYFFKNEFKISIYSALIGNLFKIFFIKIIINWIFKFDKKIRIMMSVTFEEKLKENEKIELNEKRETLIKCYIIKVKIYFGIIILLNLFIAYICICYGAFFEKSYSFFILSFLLSYVFSIIFCYCFCFVIILIYKIWKKTNNLIAIALFILLSKLY